MSEFILYSSIAFEALNKKEKLILIYSLISVKII